jgi:hypothetical protein
MPLVIADRVRETTTTSGTGTLTLAGPYSGFQAFSVIGNGNTTYYAIIDAQNGAWEVGIGAYTTSGNTLSRATVLASSNAGSLVNFGTGTKDVILTQPARRSVLVQEGGSGLITGVAAFTANGVPYADSTSTLATSANMTFNGTRLTVADLADSGLTSGRVTYASTGGALVDSANLTFDGTNLTLGGGTANGVAYLNGSKVLTTGSALVFDGANLGIGISSPNYLATLYKASLPILQLANSTSGSTASDGLLVYLNGANATISNEESGSLNFQTSGTLRATIDSSGNLGLGVTPSAWASGWKILQTPAGYFGCSNPGADGIVVGNNNYYDGSVYRYVASRRATQYQQTSSGEHFWRIAPSGTAGNAITFTQAMTLDASGNLLVGTTSPLTSASGRGNITVNGTDAVLAFGNSNSSAGYIYANSSNLEISAASTRFINFLTNGSERARIDSSGNLLVGMTSAFGKISIGQNSQFSYAQGLSLYFSGSSYWNIVNGGSNRLYFGFNGADRGYIDSSSGNYVSVSDQRLKKNIADIGYGLSSVLSLRPVSYNMNSQEDTEEKTLGFIAQSVSEMMNGMYGMDKTAIIPVLVKAIQEQQALIQTLTARVAALESN